MTLLEFRADQDLSQIEAAKIAGISVGTYCQAENGKPISKKTAQKICEAFQLNPSSMEGLNIAPRPIKRPVKTVA